MKTIMIEGRTYNVVPDTEDSCNKCAFQGRCHSTIHADLCAAEEAAGVDCVLDDLHYEEA